jgi:hypothetical protein
MVDIHLLTFNFPNVKSTLIALFVIVAIFFLFAGCKKKPEPLILSPFEVTYEVSATAPWYFPSGFCNASFYGGGEQLPLVDSFWSKTVTITETQRPLYIGIMLKSPFYFAKHETATVSIYINGIKKTSYTSKTIKLEDDFGPTVYYLLPPTVWVTIH